VVELAKSDPGSETSAPVPFDSLLLANMKLNLLGEWLSWLEESEQCESDFGPYYDDVSVESQSNDRNPGEEEGRMFRPVKQLCERDKIIVDMLNSAVTGKSTTVSFCVTDPSQLDNPVIFISDGFTKLTGYEFDEVVGRNCRFLQGARTDRNDVDKIMNAIKDEKECSVKLLNYKKDGTTFLNEVSFWLSWGRCTVHAGPNFSRGYIAAVLFSTTAKPNSGDSIFHWNTGSG